MTSECADVVCNRKKSQPPSSSTDKWAISDYGIIFSHLTRSFGFKQCLPNLRRLIDTLLTSIKRLKPLSAGFLNDFHCSWSIWRSSSHVSLFILNLIWKYFLLTSLSVSFFFFFPSLALLFLHTSLSFLTLKSVEKIICCFSKFLAGIKSTRKKKSQNY